MAKKTMDFYSPADEIRILNAYVSNKGKVRKQALEAIAKRLGRTYLAVYAKALSLNKKSNKGNPAKVRASKTSPAREARVSGSTIRFPYRSIEIDTATQEIVVKV